MKCLVYARVSTDEQVHGCEVQEAICRKEIANQGLPEPIVIKDDGVSTSKVRFRNRPGIIKLLTALEPGDHLFVWRLNRIERGFFSFIAAVNLIVDKGVWIHAVEERGGKPLDLSTAAGRAFLAIWAIAADFYREEVRDNTKRAIAWRKQNGFQTGGRLPWGRKAVPLENGLKRLDWDEEQLKIIHEIAVRYGRKESFESIARDMWARGVVDRRGRPWGQVTPRNGKTARYPWFQFAAAVRWYHRAKHKGLLPPPYGECARLVQERSTFHAEKQKRPRKPKPLAEDCEEWTLEDWQRHHREKKSGATER